MVAILRAAVLALSFPALDAVDDSALEAVDDSVAVSPVPCSVLGGLLSVDVSARCCFTTQVVTQRALEHYGMAQACKPAWQCEEDGVTPQVSFQRMALRDMCAEPACLPRVLEAMNSSWMTARGVPQYSRVCEGPVATGVKAPVHAHFARRLRARTPDVGDDPSWSQCLREVCDEEPNSPDQFVHMCDRLRSEEHACYSHCCQSDDMDQEPTTILDDGMCLPGGALADVEGRGPLPVGELRVGDRVLGRAASGGFAYEPVLAFLHASRGGPDNAVVEVLHERGVFRASPGHMVFTAGPDSRDVPAALLKPGEDDLMAAEGGGLPSRVLAVRRAYASAIDGLHAPLTASGTVVVDGVLASVYAWPSLGRRLPHHVAHTALLPVRMYHTLSLPTVLAPLAARLCAAGPGTSRAWLCRGGGLGAKEVGDELHPWLELLHRRLQLTRLLPAP